MENESCNLKALKALAVVKHIVTKENCYRECESSDWQSILNALSDLFDVDGAFIGFWKNGFIEFKYSSLSILNKYNKINHPEIYRIPIKNRINFKKEIESKGYVSINDYNLYEYALDSWKKIGLKSFLAVAIKSKDMYGTLHLISIKKQHTFSEDDKRILTAVAEVIASEFDKDKLLEKIDRERRINLQRMQLISSIKNPYGKSDYEIKEWILSTIRKIKDVVNVNTVSFTYPDENIYLVSNKKTVFHDDPKMFQDSVVCDAFKQNINKITILNNTHKTDCICMASDVKSIILLPVMHNGKTLSIVGLGLGENGSGKITQENLEFISTLFRYFAAIIYASKHLMQLSNQLSTTEEGLIKAFSSSIEAKDPYTKGHSEHVAIYAKKIAQEYGLNDNEQYFLYTAGLLHDIGKIGIPDNILIKPGSLSENEYKIMKYHPIFSYEIVKNIPKLSTILDFVRHHHEKLDGSGYPDGLKGDEISIGARILAIADIFDALTTIRPYRKHLSCDEAIKIMESEPIDQDILSKTKDFLKESYLNELSFETDPEYNDIYKIRKSIIDEDYMTGLLRRNGLIDGVNRYIKQGEKFTLFMIDIKNISYINYKYGVEIGDKIILFIAEGLKKLKKIDAVSRTGADTFMFVYTGTNQESFKELINAEIKKGMMQNLKQSSCVINIQDALKNIGCHITYTTYPDESQSAEELIYKCIIKKRELKKDSESILP